MMRRTERLFGIIQMLRTARAPVTGHVLAKAFEVSLRTLYRDMAELLAQRVPIRGEAGMGYVIDSDFDMPPLMLTVDELEAAVLGAAWVAQRGDPALARGARDLVAKLSAAVPEHLRTVLLDIWPILIGYREDVRVVAAHCELRDDFRHFRTDRMARVDVLDAPIPGRFADLRRRWEERRVDSGRGGVG